MAEIELLELKARNSSGEQTLYLAKDDPEDGIEFWFTLYGDHNGKPIQIGFDTITRSELEDIKAGIDLILQEA